jgi:hypothetical protein
MYEDQKQIWLVVGIDTTMKTVGLDIVPERNSIILNIMFKIILNQGLIFLMTGGLAIIF